MIHYITSNGIGNAWVANELSVVQKAAVPFVLHTMRRPASLLHVSKWARDLDQKTRVLYPLRLWDLAVSVFAAPFLFGGRFFAALLNAIIGRRESIRARVACFSHLFVACVWARRLRNDKVSHIHSQWAHSCCSIGMYAAWLLNKSFSFTGHGADIWRDRAALRDKIRRADFIICISTFHRDLYLKHGAKPEQLHIAYCGIDTNQFAPPTSGKQRRSDEPFHIRSSGRLVEKKGFNDLIDACKVLADRGVVFDCVIAGSGPLGKELREQIERLGLSQSVVLTGKAIMQEEISAFVHGADVFCLPCVWASDNDADGLPQMLMEAMASGAPVISTRLVGIPDLVIHEQTGLLVEPHDKGALVDAIERLRNDPDLAQQLAKEGRRFVQERFEIVSALQPLIRLYKERLNVAPGANAVEPVSELAAPANPTPGDAR
jgi:glycosyltransferase involved in cell wall biosynthesis